MTLKQQHLAILAATDRLLALLRQPGPDRVTALGDCRLDLSRLLHQQLLSEEELLIAPLRRGNLTGRIPNYASIFAEAAELRSLYSMHVQQWNLRTIQENWPGYTSSVRLLVGAVRALINRKEKELWPMAERLLDAGRSRPAPTAPAVGFAS